MDENRTPWTHLVFTFRSWKFVFTFCPLLLFLLSLRFFNPSAFYISSAAKMIEMNWMKNNKTGEWDTQWLKQMEQKQHTFPSELSNSTESLLLFSCIQGREMWKRNGNRVRARDIFVWARKIACKFTFKVTQKLLFFLGNFLNTKLLLISKFVSLKCKLIKHSRNFWFSKCFKSFFYIKN